MYLKHHNFSQSKFDEALRTCLISIFGNLLIWQFSFAVKLATIKCSHMYLSICGKPMENRGKEQYGLGGGR